MCGKVSGVEGACAKALGFEESQGAGAARGMQCAVAGAGKGWTGVIFKMPTS